VGAGERRFHGGSPNGEKEKIIPGKTSFEKVLFLVGWGVGRDEKRGADYHGGPASDDYAKMKGRGETEGGNTQLAGVKTPFSQRATCRRRKDGQERVLRFKPRKKRRGDPWENLLSVGKSGVHYRT